jgi:hypothetical protein
MNAKIILATIIALSFASLEISTSTFANDESSNALPYSSVTFSYSQNGVNSNQTVVIPETTNANWQASYIYSNYAKFASAISNYPDANELLALSKTNEVAGLPILTNSSVSKLVVEWTSMCGEASSNLISLKEQGLLPGMPKDSHGNLTIGDGELWASKQIKFPAWLTIDVVKDGDILTNHYTFSQQAKGSAWKLQRAWRSDFLGKAIEEWYVK